jgi:hypothetical protein
LVDRHSSEFELGPMVGKPTGTSLGASFHGWYRYLIMLRLAHSAPIDFFSVTSLDRPVFSIDSYLLTYPNRKFITFEISFHQTSFVI